jgi:hypothetical protein
MFGGASHVVGKTSFSNTIHFQVPDKCDFLFTQLDPCSGITKRNTETSEKRGVFVGNTGQESRIHSKCPLRLLF